MKAIKSKAGLEFRSDVGEHLIILPELLDIRGGKFYFDGLVSVFNTNGATHVAVVYGELGPKYQVALENLLGEDLYRRMTGYKWVLKSLTDKDFYNITTKLKIELGLPLH